MERKNKKRSTEKAMILEKAVKALHVELTDDWVLIDIHYCDKITN